MGLPVVAVALEVALAPEDLASACAVAWAAEARSVYSAAAEQMGCFGPRLHPTGKPGPHNRGLQEKIPHEAQAFSAPTAEKRAKVLSCKKRGSIELTLALTNAEHKEKYSRAWGYHRCWA